MADDQPPPDVLSSLPRTRPQRRSARRDTPPAGRARAARKEAPGAAAGAPSRRLPPAGFAPPERPEANPLGNPVEIAGTALQAAAELAQIGLAVGGQALRSALGRLAGRP